jgi:cell division protein FtsW
MGDGTALKKKIPSPFNRNNRRRAEAGDNQAGTARKRRAARADQKAAEGMLPDRRSNLDSMVAPAPPARKEAAAGADSLPRRPVSLGFDVPLLLIVSTIAIIGMIALFSASWLYSLADYGSPTVIFTRQLGWLGLGVVVGTALFFLDYHRWKYLALPLMLGTIGLLGLVLVVQDERHGAVRSLMGGSIQPSELAKLALIIYLSVWLFNRREILRDAKLALAPLAVILGLIGAFIAAQPDLSALITVGVLGIMLLFLAGGDIKQIVLVLGPGSVIGYLILESGIFATGKERMDSYLAGLRDPLQASDHVQRSMEAFIRGGWFGQGIGNSTAKLTVLPFPHTDSIFAVIGEEAGVIGAAAMVLLFALIVWRGLVIARRAPDMLGTLLAAGLSFWIAMEALVNMAVMVGLLPFAGNALPLVSSGGSNRVVTLAAIGIILNISRLSEKSREEELGKRAVVDLRGGDWRRRVSSPRRSPGAGD